MYNGKYLTVFCENTYIYFYGPPIRSQQCLVVKVSQERRIMTIQGECFPDDSRSLSILPLPVVDGLVYYNWHHNRREHQELQNTYQSKISAKN